MLFGDLNTWFWKSDKKNRIPVFEIIYASVKTFNRSVVCFWRSSSFLSLNKQAMKEESFFCPIQKHIKCVKRIYIFLGASCSRSERRESTKEVEVLCFLARMEGGFNSVCVTFLLFVLFDESIRMCSLPKWSLWKNFGQCWSKVVVSHFSEPLLFHDRTLSFCLDSMLKLSTKRTYDVAFSGENNLLTSHQTPLKKPKPLVCSSLSCSPRNQVKESYFPPSNWNIEGNTKCFVVFWGPHFLQRIIRIY